MDNGRGRNAQSRLAPRHEPLIILAVYDRGTPEQGGFPSFAARAPAARREYALIRLLCGGICNTDLELQRGYYGFRGIPGHEVCRRGGRGALAERWSAKRVVGEINLAWAAACDWCLARAGPPLPESAPYWASFRHPEHLKSTSFCRSETCTWVRPAVRPEHAVFTEPVGRGLRNPGSVANPARRGGGCVG